MDTVSGWFGMKKQDVASAVEPAIPPVPSGVQPESPGMTTTGGRRYRKRGGKTRKMKKGGKRTRKH